MFNAFSGEVTYWIKCMHNLRLGYLGCPPNISTCMAVPLQGGQW